MVVTVVVNLLLCNPSATFSGRIYIDRRRRFRTSRNQYGAYLNWKGYLEHGIVSSFLQKVLRSNFDGDFLRIVLCHVRIGITDHAWILQADVA